MTLLDYLTILENNHNSIVFKEFLEAKFDPGFWDIVNETEEPDNPYAIIRRYWWQLMLVETDQEFHFFGYYTNYSIPELLIPFSLSSFQNGLFLFSLLQDLRYMTDMLKKMQLVLSIIFFIHSLFKIAIDVALLGISIVTRFIATLCYITHYCFSSDNYKSLNLNDLGS